MTALDVPPVSPWAVEVVVVTPGSHTGAERRALGRDVEQGLRSRIGPAMYVRSAEFDPLSPEAQHTVLLRAVTAASARPVVFSHWSAAVLHGLPVLWPRLERPHVVIRSENARSRVGLAQHLLPLHGAEVVRLGDLLVTGLTRTVLDLAGAAALEEGVIAADAALLRGVPREALAAAVDLAGPRQASRRIANALAFAHPGAESAAESRTRVTAYRLGVEMPELQRRFVLRNGAAAYADEFFPRADGVLEIDGASKYLDPRIATSGAGRAAYAEKLREDDVRAQVRGFARSGWAHSASPALLRPVLARIGVSPLRPRTGFEDWCAAALEARPRRRS